ncbi:MAG: hypothetical protein ACKVQU_00470 [Burkholderiales bacterium]
MTNSEQLPSASGKPDSSSFPTSQVMPTVEQALALTGYATQKGMRSEHIAALCGKVRGQPPKKPIECEALTDYAAVAQLVAPVSGASVVDSTNVDGIIKPVRWTTYFVLAVTLIHGMLNAWFGDLPEPEEGPLAVAYQVQRYALDFASPFFWGGLGSCVYLLKRYGDLAEDRLFDEDSMQGWGTRILLGSILGGVVQFLYDSSVFTASGLHLDANALGFLSGVGVKVVYGAIEKTISALGEAMNLDAVRKAPAREDALRKFLAIALADETDATKRAVIAGLLDKVGSQPPRT